ncbi:Do family serine endopeptidase [Propionivibrio dicarboxylicus]|nr:Do family serine endopeptidase [Propionivibrio dicarboxylicus]
MAAIVARNGQSVVNISIAGTHKVKSGMSDTPIDPEDPFFDLFRRFGIPQQPSETPVHALGSGFIVSPDGTILTNAHVVEDADEVTVKLTDKREFRAKVLGMDKASDIAVLKIQAENLPVVQIGKADQVKVGEWVLAIGSPFGFENSATAGIVSAKSRSLPDGGYVPFIQTDVAVNPGNSGGPLFNTAGEVIGVNSQIYSRSGGYQGLSFAIPIDVAMNVEKQIVEHGKVEHGRLGVMVQEVSQPLAQSFGLSKPGGALVGNVEKGSPAAKAGLASGDVILGINGRDIASSGELAAVVANIHPGDTAKLQVWRKGSMHSVEVSVGSATGSNTLASSDKRESETDHGKLGVSVRPLTSDELAEAGVKGGLVVQDVSGPAAAAGIQAGDILLSVNGEALAKPEQLRSLIAKAGKHVAILVERGNTKLFVPIDLG